MPPMPPGAWTTYYRCWIGQPERARRTWDGFLSWGRLNGQLLAAGGLREQYVQVVARIAEFTEESQRQLYRHLAAVALLRDPDPAISQWARSITSHAQPSVRAEWMNQIGWDMSALSANAWWDFSTAHLDAHLLGRPAG